MFTAIIATGIVAAIYWLLLNQMRNAQHRFTQFNYDGDGPAFEIRHESQDIFDTPSGHRFHTKKDAADRMFAEELGRALDINIDDTRIRNRIAQFAANRHIIRDAIDAYERTMGEHK